MNITERRAWLRIVPYSYENRESYYHTRGHYPGALTWFPCKWSNLKKIDQIIEEVWQPTQWLSGNCAVMRLKYPWIRRKICLDKWGVVTTNTVTWWELCHDAASNACKLQRILFSSCLYVRRYLSAKDVPAIWWCRHLPIFRCEKTKKKVILYEMQNSEVVWLGTISSSWQLPKF